MGEKACNSPVSIQGLITAKDNILLKNVYSSQNAPVVTKFILLLPSHHSRSFFFVTGPLKRYWLM